MESNSEEIKSPWKDPKDQLERAKYADILTKYLSQKSGEFVLNLDAPWGMGKTYFIRHWHKSLEDKHPAVYINAWETDFSDDPLVTVISGVHEQLKNYLPTADQNLESFGRKLKSGGRFLKSLSPIIAKGLLKKALGSEEGKALLDNIGLSDDADVVSEISEKSMSVLLKNHSEATSSMKDFSKALGDVIRSIDKKNVSLPVFLFIDELDRCRPTYAIELLETVKHLFNVDNIVFVIATDSAQLRHAISAVYGDNFDGELYLGRFFHQRYKLPDPNYSQYCKFKTGQITNIGNVTVGCFRPWHILGNKGKEPSGWDSSDSVSVLLTFYSRHFSLPLRSIVKIVTQLEAIFSLINGREIDIVYLLLLLTCNESKPGVISWARGIVSKINTSGLNEQIKKYVPSDGQKIGWVIYGYNGCIAENEINVFQIFSTYLRTLSVQVDDISYIDPDKVTSLDEYILQIRYRYENKHKTVKYSNYFDLVEMAGGFDI